MKLVSFSKQQELYESYEFDVWSVRRPSSTVYKYLILFAFISRQTSWQGFGVLCFAVFMSTNNNFASSVRISGRCVPVSFNLSKIRYLFNERKNLTLFSKHSNSKLESIAVAARPKGMNCLRPLEC
jgi:hypothetical protein